MFQTIIEYNMELRADNNKNGEVSAHRLKPQLVTVFPFAKRNILKTELSISYTEWIKNHATFLSAKKNFGFSYKYF